MDKPKKKSRNRPFLLGFLACFRIDDCKVKLEKLDELCQKAGISKGAFYMFFPSKERLFYETLLDAEYDKSPFLYDTARADFTGFNNKLAPGEQEAIGFDSLAGAKRLLGKLWWTHNEKMAVQQAASLKSNKHKQTRAGVPVYCVHYACPPEASRASAACSC